MENALEKNPVASFSAIIAVDERGTAVLLKSTPSLYEHDHFDGFFLSDNLTNEKDVPQEPGIYQCDIKYHSYKSWTDCGYEYDCNVWLENIVSVLPIK